MNKRIFVIDDAYQIAEQMIDVSSPNKVVVAVGYYDTIQELFNILIKSDNDYEFIGGQLEPVEWGDYEEAWYVEIMDDNEMYVGKMQYDGRDDYIVLEADYSFVEEDFLDQYLENNDTNGLTVFGFDDVHPVDNDKDNCADTCLCMDKDNLGFTFCVTDEYGYHKLRYRGNHELTKDDAWEIVAENYGE